ncbi:alpha/beta hydrolase [Dietzia sp. B32]|uniref:alpha/beta hydrolase n=1 Tax=Dietzia sp. B32 TaxID=2915130 RepID=UPI0021AD748D|nr:alpha/beta hydrolase [Dietzia sp. B32]UVE94570.1 alpha/beta hydrolase [Dietzia sp. B32]
MNGSRSRNPGPPYDGGLRLPRSTGSGEVPQDGRRSSEREADRPSRRRGPALHGPSEQGTLRSRGLAGGLRLFVRPALDRMPATDASLGRLRALTSGAGRAAALESTNDWSSDGPVPGLWVGRKRFFDSDKVIYHVHGGGFTFGSPWSHKALASRIASETGVPVFLPDYRLAPEHPHPAATEDTIAGWEWLLEMGFPAENIVVAGDSAGGNLAMQLVAHLERTGAPMPAGVVLLSPWVDLDFTDMTARDRARKDPFLALGLAELCRRQYAPGVDTDDPAISPINYEPSPDWPPFLIQCGGEEIFRGGIEKMAENFAEHGVRHEFQLWPHQFHVFQVFHPLVPEAKVAVRDIGSFVRGCLRG